MKAYLGMVLQKPKSRPSQLTPETPMRRRGIMAALTSCEAALIYMGWRSILPVTSGMLLVNASRASAFPVKEQHLWALSYHFKEHRHMPQLYSAAEKKTACEWIPVVSRAVLGLTQAIHQGSAANGYRCPSLAPTQWLEIASCSTVLQQPEKDQAQKNCQPDWPWHASYAFLHPWTACFSHQPFCGSSWRAGALASLCKAEETINSQICQV